MNVFSICCTVMTITGNEFPNEKGSSSQQNRKKNLSRFLVHYLTGRNKHGFSHHWNLQQSFGFLFLQFQIFFFTNITGRSSRILLTNRNMTPIVPGHVTRLQLPDWAVGRQLLKHVSNTYIRADEADTHIDSNQNTYSYKDRNAAKMT